MDDAQHALLLTSRTASASGGGASASGVVHPALRLVVHTRYATATDP